MKIQETIEVPAPTAWPIVLAFGITLAFAGLVTAAPVTILGAALAVAGATGWFRDVLPVEKHEWEPVVHEDIAIETSRVSVERIAELPALSRAALPVEIYPISAGVKGGLAGAVAMALLAGAYGLFSGNGIWYPMNLLVAGLFPEMATQTSGQIGAFSARALDHSGAHSFDDFASGRTALRSDAADGFEAADSTGRFRGAAAVVLSDLWQPGGHQSGNEPAHRLAVVCDLPNGIWNCGWAGGRAPGAD